MRKKRKPTVGETLYSLSLMNVNLNKPQTLTPVVVSSVGRKYFTVGVDYGARKYHLNDWIEKTEYGPTTRLYESEQEWEEQKEVVKIAKHIGKAFEYGNNLYDIPLNILRQIAELIDTNKESNTP